MPRRFGGHRGPPGWYGPHRHGHWGGPGGGPHRHGYRRHMHPGGCCLLPVLGCAAAFALLITLLCIFL